MGFEEYDTYYFILYNRFYSYLETKFLKAKSEELDLPDKDFKIEFKSSVQEKMNELYENYSSSNSYLKNILEEFYHVNYKRNKVLNFFQRKIPRYKKIHTEWFEQKNPNGRYDYLTEFMYTATDEEHIRIFAKYSAYSDIIKLINQELRFDENLQINNKFEVDEEPSHEHPIEVVAWIFAILGKESVFKLFNNSTEISELQAPITKKDSKSAKKDFAQYYQNTILHYRDGEYHRALVRGSRKADQIKKLDMLIDIFERNSKILREVKKSILR